MKVKQIIMWLCTTLIMTTNVSAYFGGGDGAINSPYKITTISQLDSVRYFLSSHFELINDLDFKGSVYDSANSVDHKGWLPIGDEINTFTGTFEGRGHTISHMYIDRSVNYNGLFGFITGASIDSIAITNFTIIVGSQVSYFGGLCGYSSSGTISNSYATGTLNNASESSCIGGLCGYNGYGTISNCYTKANVTGGYNIGGLCGYNYGTILNCFAIGNVTGGTASFNLGGLCGYSENGAINNCYAIGEVTGSYNIGSLCGDSYKSTINSSYYNSHISIQSDNGKGSPKSSLELMQKATFVGWDFDSIWSVDENVSYPMLKGFTKISKK